MANNNFCCKCKTGQATIRIRHAFYCHDCFLFAVVGKYRTILGKSRSMNRAKGKVLLACSGGPSSISMLHMTKEFMHVEPYAKKKIQVLDSALVCHIDESALFETQNGSTQKMKEMVEKEFPNMDFLSSSLQDIFLKDFTKDADLDTVLKEMDGSSDYDYLVKAIKQESTLNSETDRIDRLRELFDGINKNTAKEDLYWHIKMTMLVTLAKKEGCSYIFMGDTATRQAIKMISMTGKGRGYSIPFDIGVENDITFPGLTILRPMKDMLSKEIGLYNRFKDLEKYVIPPTDFNTGKPAKSSIERLTEEFITTLDRDFPSTVSTISRTASKLTPLNDMDLSKKCAICNMPYQAGIEDWRRRITVTNVKDKSPDAIPNEEKKKLDDSMIDMNEYLCYSCQVDMKDYKNDTVSRLPPYSVKAILDEYLIDDNDEE